MQDQTLSFDEMMVVGCCRRGGGTHLLSHARSVTGVASETVQIQNRRNFGPFCEFSFDHRRRSCSLSTPLDEKDCRALSVASLRCKLSVVTVFWREKRRIYETTSREGSLLTNSFAGAHRSLLLPCTRLVNDSLHTTSNNTLGCPA